MERDPIKRNKKKEKFSPVVIKNKKCCNLHQWCVAHPSGVRQLVYCVLISHHWSNFQAFDIIFSEWKMVRQGRGGGVSCRLFLKGDIFHYASAATHPGRDDQAVALKQVLFCSGCQLFLPALSLRQPWSIFDLWLPKLFNFDTVIAVALFFLAFNPPASRSSKKNVFFSCWGSSVCSAQGQSQAVKNFDIFVYGALKKTKKNVFSGFSGTESISTH